MPTPAPDVLEYISATQAGMDKAAAELAEKDSAISKLAAEKKAGTDLIQQVVDSLVSGGMIVDDQAHRKAAAAKLGTYKGAMEMLAGAAVFQPNTKAASLGEPVPAPAATNPPVRRMTPDPQAGLSKLAATIGANVS